VTVPIYLDYNATTPMDPAVLAAMLPWLREGFGNPSSDHAYGQRAKAAMGRARQQVAALIGAAAESMIFTGSATEANNLALLGSARRLAGRTRRRLVTSAIEHPSVLQPLRHLATNGWEVVELPVDGDGRVDLDQAARAITPATALVSVMLANNETGVIQPVAAVAELAQAVGARLHVDAAQAVGKIPVEVDVLGADLLTLAGHKFHAPKGVGALYVRAGAEPDPIQFGAAQEQGLRPGTENVPHIVALGEAAALAHARLASDSRDIGKLRDRLHDRLQASIPGLRLNGHPIQRLPGTLNLSFPAVSGRHLLADCPELAASTGSACHASEEASSGVLGAMGCDPARAAGAVRLSLGRFLTEHEVDQAAAALIDAWRRNTQGGPGSGASGETQRAD